MVFNASILDWLALALFFAAVVAYSRYADHIGDRLLNARMREVRAIWMRRYLERADRVVDSILTGHSINSIALFSSATLLIVVALLGLLTNADTAYHVAITSSFVTHTRSEEHTSELQSQSNLVCRLLLEKKKKKKNKR